ncbi:tetratricopeptide repeat protein [Streptomyces sp. NPDC058470]|uniref:tetratricopeptide repeat protein n=1 Tax=Streptomyces sp. NPDC058470 TaxID=3346515 RepID=UPI00365EAA95
MELLLRARELARARKFRESRARVDRAEPRSARELSLAASVLVELRDPQAALPLADRVVEPAPDDWRGHLAVADVTCQLRWWDQSVAAARTEVAVAPEEAQAHRVLSAAANRIVGGGREAGREARRAKELGGRGATRMPGRRSPWWFVVFLAPLAGPAVLPTVGAWPDTVDELMLLSHVLLPVLLLLLIVVPSRAGLTWPERIAEIRAVNEERYGGGGHGARTRAGLVALLWGSAPAGAAALLAVPAADGNPLSALFLQAQAVPEQVVVGLAQAVPEMKVVGLGPVEREIEAFGG